MVSNADLYNCRRSHVMKWLKSHDFIILQETHSGLGKDSELGWELGDKVKTFNSPHLEKSKALSTAGIMLMSITPS